MADVSEVMFNEIAFRRLMRAPGRGSLGHFDTQGKKRVARPAPPAGGKLPPLSASARSADAPVKFHASVLDALDNGAEEITDEHDAVDKQ